MKRRTSAPPRRRARRHTLHRACGANIPSFIHTPRMASCTTFMPSICSCRKPEPSTSWIVATSTLPAFMCCTKPGPSSSRVPSRTSMLIASIRRRRIARPASFATRPSPWTASTPVRITPNFCGHPLQGPRSSGKTLVFITNNFSLPAATICALYKSRWQRTLLQVDQAASSDQAVLRHVGERGDAQTQIWIAVSVYVLVSSRSASTWTPRLYTFYPDPLGDPLRENAHTSSTGDAGFRRRVRLAFLRP